MSLVRRTTQRLKILEYLRSVKSHPTAELIYEHVKKDLPAISLATVYRNLNLLSQMGEITKLEISNEAHFDGNTCCHQHCICKRCGRILDMFHKEITGYAMKKIQSNEFTAECVCILFKGYCKDCQGNNGEINNQKNNKLNKRR